MSSYKLEIAALIRKLNEATEQYDAGHPIMSDKEWDDLYFKLKKREEETGIIFPNSPTQKIHFTKVSELKKVNHNHLMLSLDKTKDVKNIDKFLQNYDFIAMAKLDGLTCSLRYLNGELVSAETRGDGKTGEDILHNALVIPSIPKKINYLEELIVDGEIICTYSNFEKFKDKYKNPRNFASGSIRLLDSKECFSRNLTFVVWDIIKGFKNDYLHNRLLEAEKLGFTVVPWTGDNPTAEDDISEIKELSNKKSYPIDGVVFKIESREISNELGYTAHHFNNAIAYKFYDETYETEVKDIEWTMGRTGQLTPVLIYNDIEIDGAICNRASLHNITVMTQLMGRAYPGQKVFIYKANQIIPQVESAQTNNPNHIPGIQIPKICPYCGHLTEIRKDNDSEVLYCTNEQCESRLVNRLDHFCGKKGLDIKGLSKATLGKFIEWGWIENIEDLYNIGTKYRENFILKPGFGIKSVTKILNAIEESKHTTLDAFISAIGIPLIGRAVAKDLTNYFETYEDFRNAVNDKNYHFYDLDNFGEEMDKSIKNFNYAEADRISKLLFIEAPVVNKNQINNSLTGKTIVITGKLTNFKNRAELKTIIENHGGKVVDSISAKTDILINNDVNSTSSKNKAAKERNIPIMSELDFIKNYVEN